MSDLYEVNRFAGAEVSADGSKLTVKYETNDDLYLLVLKKGVEINGKVVDRFVKATRLGGAIRLLIEVETNGVAGEISLYKGDFLEGLHVMKLDDPIEEFVASVYKFHGPDSSSPVAGVTKEAIREATADFMRHEEFIGDAYDRAEVVKLLPNFIK